MKRIAKLASLLGLQGSHLISDGAAGIGAKMMIGININYNKEQGLMIQSHGVIEPHQLQPYEKATLIATAKVVTSIIMEFCADRIMTSLGTRDAEKMFNVGTNLDVGDPKLEPPTAVQELGPEDVGEGEDDFDYDFDATQVKDTPVAPFAPLVPPPP